MLPSTNLFNRKIRQIVGKTLDAVCFLDYIIARKSSNFSKHDFEPHSEFFKKSNLIIFVHFSKKLIWDEFDIDTLRQLLIKRDNLIVISNSPNTTGIDCAYINSRNRGRDLGVYRDVSITLLKNNFSGRVIFINNSIIWRTGYGLHSVLQFLCQESSTKVVKAITDSHQKKHHLQSYALGIDINAKTLNSPFSHVRNFAFKRTLVSRGEIPALQNFLNEGYEIDVYLPYSRLIQKFLDTDFIEEQNINIKNLIRSGVPLNPSQHFWKQLIEDNLMGIKRTLLSSNPARLANIPCGIQSSFQLDQEIDLILRKKLMIHPKLFES